MSTILQNKNYEETKKFLTDLYLNNYASDDIKSRINDLYEVLNIKNSHDIRQEANELLVCITKNFTDIRNNEINNRIPPEISIYMGMALIYVCFGSFLFFSLFIMNCIIDSKKPSKIRDFIEFIYVCWAVIAFSLMFYYGIFYHVK